MCAIFETLCVCVLNCALNFYYFLLFCVFLLAIFGVMYTAVATAAGESTVLLYFIDVRTFLFAELDKIRRDGAKCVRRRKMKVIQMR